MWSLFVNGEKLPSSWTFMVAGTVAQSSVLRTPFKYHSLEGAECLLLLALPPQLPPCPHRGPGRAGRQGMGGMARREDGKGVPWTWLPLAT